MSQLATLQAEMRGCRLCVEQGHEVVAGAVFSGVRSAEIMLIGQAPGHTEVEAQRPFNANAGRRLFQWLGEAGWDEATFRQQQYMTSVTKCYPGKHKSGRGDRVPSKAEQALCHPYLLREMMLVAPRVIIPVGGLAIQRFYPKQLKLNEIIGRAVCFAATEWQVESWFTLSDGQVLDYVPASASHILLPLPHPSGASLWPNRPENKALIGRAIDLLQQIRVQWLPAKATALSAE